MGKPGRARRRCPGSAPPLGVAGRRGDANVYPPLADVEMNPVDSPTEKEAKDEMTDSVHGARAHSKLY